MNRFRKDNRLVLISVFVLMALVVALCGTVFAFAEYAGDLKTQLGNLYAQTTTVVEISEPNDTVTVRDFNGNLWQFYGTDDWAVGDICSLVFDSMGTAEIKDDVIISARYNAGLNGEPVIKYTVFEKISDGSGIEPPDGIEVLPRTIGFGN